MEFIASDIIGDNVFSIEPTSKRKEDDRININHMVSWSNVMPKQNEEKNKRKERKSTNHQLPTIIILLIIKIRHMLKSLALKNIPTNLKENKCVPKI